MTGRGIRAAFAAATIALALPAGAQAATVSYSGNTVFLAADGSEDLDVSVGYDEQQYGGARVTFYTSSPINYDPNQCDFDNVSEALYCKLGNGVTAVRVVGGPADDWLRAYSADLGGFQAGAPYQLAFHGGGGNDRLTGRELGETLDGGPGMDELEGFGGDDTLLGGAGNDTLKGHDGSDRLYGGDDMDTLTGDDSGDTSTIGADVLDGGAGRDVVEEDWHRLCCGGSDMDPPPTVTLDGLANDGRPGEGDNLVGVEEIKGTWNDQGRGSFTGDDGPQTFIMFGASYVAGAGGDDTISGSNGPDELDGGAGDDRIEGGSADDVVTGGPGRDTLSGDRPASCFYGPIYGSCSVPNGNDTIHAVDGEADSIDCGIGTDTAYVDAVDVVSNCEQVHVSGGANKNDGPPVCCAPPSPEPEALARPRFARVPAVRLRAFLRSGLRPQVRCVGGCRITASLTVDRRTARRYRLRYSTIARARGVLRKAGTKTLSLRPGRKVRARLKRARVLKTRLTVTITDANGRKTKLQRRVTVRR